MKFMVILLAIFACVSADDWTPKKSREIREIRQACMETISLTESQKKKIENFDFPNDEAVRKYIVCTLEKMEICCTSHGFHVNRLIKQTNKDLGSEQGKDVVEECLRNNPKGDNEIEIYAHDVYTCLIDEVTKIIES
uniref:Odorant binding protein n=1 Tax=Stomoxys calcitrans TaxID=35570 RepID=A0A1I8QD38_STOCA